MDTASNSLHGLNALCWLLYTIISVVAVAWLLANVNKFTGCMTAFFLAAMAYGLAGGKPLLR